jgi:hypothetical protein
MNPDTSTNSLPTLLRELRDESTTLIRQEVRLAKTELRENVSHLGQHAVQIAIGAFVAYAGLIVLLLGLGQLLGVAFEHAGFDRDLSQWLAPAIVGVGTALLGWILLSRARHALAREDLAPRQTIASLKTTKAWAQDKLQTSS